MCIHWSCRRNERAITIRDDGEDEEGFVTIGMDALGRVLVVVYAWRDDRPRLISARPATARECDSTRGGHETRLRLHPVNARRRPEGVARLVPHHHSAGQRRAG